MHAKCTQLLPVGQTARGIDGSEGTRNSPTLINRGYGRVFSWDGRADLLERQALQPILNPSELGLTEPELERWTDEQFHNTGVV